MFFFIFWYNTIYAQIVAKFWLENDRSKDGQSHKPTACSKTMCRTAGDCGDPESW